VRNLVEAVVEAAKNHGVIAVLVSGEGSNGHAPPAAGADADVVARYNAALGRVQALEGQIARDTDAVRAAQSERDLYAARIREHEATIAQLRANGSAATATMGGTTAPQGGSLDDQSIDILGIDDDAAKKLKRREWTTIGKLRSALLEGKLASEAKFTKDAIIAVSWLLLGKTPPSTLPAGAPAAAPSATGAADVPTGFTDRPWKERLGAARKKERDRKVIEGKIAALTAQMNAVTDPAQKGALQQEVAAKMGTLDTVCGQMFCLLWACGLINPGTFGNVKELTVDAALTVGGLPHLVETPPQPQGAAAAQAPTAPQA
jgi:hypothetical protein